MNDRKPMDFTGMKPSDALEKAHEAYPEVKWDWQKSKVNQSCGCAAALLCFAVGRKSERITELDDVFSSICLQRPSTTGVLTYHAWDVISSETMRARSFHEAIALLRARGW